jgi:hypothetical protein
VFHLGDKVLVLADGPRHGQSGVIEKLLPALSEQDFYQVCIIAFQSEDGKAKECYFVKELRATTRGLKCSFPTLKAD